MFVATAIGGIATAVGGLGIGGAVLGAGALGLAGSYLQSNAASKASAASIAAQQGMFNTSLMTNQPFIQAGSNAAGTLTNLLTPGPSQTETLSQLPGYKFAQDWGQKAVQNIGSTQGLGGNTLTAGANFATGLAQNQFSTYANLLQNQENAGVSAGGALTGAATATGQGVGSSAASGIMGSANAIAGGLTGAGNTAMNGLLLNKLFSGGANANASQNLGIYNSNAGGISVNDAQYAF
jgi:hypothetical protein